MWQGENQGALAILAGHSRRAKRAFWIQRRILDQPMDFVFLIEGALFFAAAAVRRHGVGGNSGMAYPFAVRTAGVGYASASANDELADKSNTEELGCRCGIVRLTETACSGAKGGHKLTISRQNGR
jgi:hypothetical protein